MFASLRTKPPYTRLLALWVILSVLGYGTMTLVGTHGGSESFSEASLVQGLDTHTEDQGRHGGVDSSCCHCCHGIAHLLGLSRNLQLHIAEHRAIPSWMPELPFSSQVSAPPLRPPIA